MAKYEITFICGHTETKELYGKTSERENKIAWLEKQVCSECYKKELHEQEEIRANDLHLPNLTGSQKQIEWANKIRDGFFKDWENLRKKYGESDDERSVQFFEWVKSQKESRFWIDNRGKTIYQIAKEWNDNHNKIEAQESSKELEKAAKEEATVYPENEATKDIAEISYTEKLVEIKSPKNEIIIDTVRSAGYKWDRDKTRWCLKITVTRGHAEDRAAEIGNLLLNEGVPICIYDEEIRGKAIRGDFEPQKYQWILKYGDEEVEVFWRGRENSLYDEAKRLPHAKYREGVMRIPSRYFEEIREFARIYDLGISKNAEELLAKEEKAYKEKIVIAPKKPTNIIEREDQLKEILQSSRDILEDLRDED